MFKAFIITFILTFYSCTKKLIINKPCSKESIVNQCLSYHKKRLENMKYQFFENDSTYLIDIWGDSQRSYVQIEILKKNCEITKHVYSQ